jgi:putative ATP-binding cassette transporter
VAETHHRSAWARFARVVRQFFTSAVRWKARVLAGVLLGLLLAISGLNVVNSYVGRDFMTSLADRRAAEFYWFALLYVGVFAASTAVASFQNYAQARLGLVWRAWLTERLVGCYLRDRAYYRLRDRAGVDNPDERISEDVRAFTDTALGFVVMLVNGAITVVAFAGVTWSISPLLFGVCVGYAVLGSLGTVWLGRKLAGLNGRQLAREADFRAALLHVRTHATAVALTGTERPLHARLRDRLRVLIENFRNMINVNLRLSLFTGGYNYLIQIIPALVVGPLYIRGEVPFGVVTQAAMAFAQLIGALSLVITQFGSISSFAAVVARVNGLEEAMEESRAPEPGGIETAETPDRMAFADLTLRDQRNKEDLVRDLDAAVEDRQRLAVSGPNEQGQEALFMAAAGLWQAGHGRVERPPLAAMRFVPQTPFVLPGTLRDQFRAADPDAAADDARVLAALEAAGLENLPRRVGGLDVEHEWGDHLTLGEQQALALAGVFFARPRFAVVDRISTTLGAKAAAEVLGRLEEAGTGLVNFTGAESPENHYDTVLELHTDGSWAAHGPPAGRSIEEAGRSP